MTDEQSEFDEQGLRKVLSIVLLVAFAFLVVTLFFQMSPSGNTTSHPPQVTIARYNDTINITYLGGIDNAFVGDFKVTYSNETLYFAKPRYQGDLIGSFIQPNYTCVKVEATDLAVKSYRPIGNSCL